MSVSNEKVGLIQRIKNSFTNTTNELKRVTWPDKHTLFVYTAVVIGVSLFLALVIWLLDLGIGALLGLVIK